MEYIREESEDPEGESLLYSPPLIWGKLDYYITYKIYTIIPINSAEEEESDEPERENIRYIEEMERR
jgi:hypothetical protein